MLNKKNIISFLILILFSFSFAMQTKASDILTKTNNISAKSPKLANIFLSWELNDEDVINLAKWDLIILDMEHQFNNPDKIKKIRELNPNIIILAYISSQEIRNDVYLYDYLHLRKEMFEAIPEEWYLKVDNKKLSFWPETWMLNSFSDAPTVNGDSWVDFLPQFVSSRIIASGVWDGIFYDNFFDTIDWLDNSFQSDALNLNNKWREGNIKILKKTRELIGYDYIVLINSSSYEDYQVYINGRVFEDFPIPFKGDGSWQTNINSYKKIHDLNVNPKFYIFNVTNNNFSDFSKMRYGLASSLMFENIYLSFDKSIKNHGQTWYYDEYSLDFSKTKNKAYQVNSNIWRRDFEYFSVLLNTGDSKLEVDFPENFKKAYSWWNDNQGKLILDKQEAVILEPQLTIYNKHFRNKAEYLGFNYLGKKVYTAYNLITSDDFQDGELVFLSEDNNFYQSNIKNREYKIDSNNNGFLEKVEGSLSRDKSLVKIYNSNNKLVGLFRAFPDAFNCGVRVAVADVDGDGLAEIITMPYWGGPHVRIFDFYGNLKYEFFAGDKNLRAFYDLELVDINSKGIKEIFVNSY